MKWEDRQEQQQHQQQQQQQQQRQVTVVEVGSPKTRSGCNSDTLSKAVFQFVSRAGGFDCGKRDVIFRCHNEKEDFQTRIAKDSLGWAVPVRAAFKAANSMSTSTAVTSASASGITNLHMYTPRSIQEAKRAGRLVVVVHVRRGDVIRPPSDNRSRGGGAKIDREHRLMSFGAYKSILRQLLHVKASLDTSTSSSDSVETRSQKLKKQPVSIFFLCEGAPNNHTVIDYDDQNPSKPVIMVDLENRGSSGLREQIQCQREQDQCRLQTLVEKTSSPAAAATSSGVDGDTSYLSAFSAMCVADILVTSLSSFPFVAASICEPPVTLALPFSQGYTGIEGVVDLHPAVSGKHGSRGGAGGSNLWRSSSEVEVPVEKLKEVMLRRLPGAGVGAEIV